MLSWKRASRFFHQRIEAITRGRFIPLKKYELSYYGVYLRSRKNDLTFGYSVKGHYGDFLSDLINDLKENVIFIDIGANIGLYSLLAAKNPYVSDVFSFEPDPITFNYLKDNVRRSGSTKISLQNFAVGAESRTRHLTQSYGHSGGATLLSGKKRFNSSRRKVEVRNEIMLNALIPDNENEIFVKIDVEGSEYEVLLTLAKTRFFDRIVHLVIEFDLKYTTISHVIRLLQENGYQEVSRSGDEQHWDAYWIKS